MHLHTRTDVRGNQKTEVISFCAKWYRLAHQLMDVVNFDVLADWSLFLSVLGGHLGTYQIKLSGELNGS